MSEKRTIETIGYIHKEEKLVTLKQNVIPNTFVIEMEKPYPGYHGKDLPGEKTVPEFIFFITKKKYTTEHLARVTKNIKKYFGEGIDIARAELTVYNQVLSSIRIKGPIDFSKIADLQSCYVSEGIQFAKTKKIDTKGLINIQKHFYIEEISEGIYHDLYDANSYYLQIPVKLSWEQFKAITLKIKNSMEVDNFDAALGLFYRKDGVVDMVRIYDKEPNIEKLNDIQSRYINEIKKLLLDEFSK